MKKKELRAKYTIPYAVPYYLKKVLDDKYSNLLGLLNFELIQRMKEMEGWGEFKKEMKNCRIEIGFEIKVYQKDTK